MSNHARESTLINNLALWNVLNSVVKHSHERFMRPVMFLKLSSVPPQIDLRRIRQERLCHNRSRRNDGSIGKGCLSIGCPCGSPILLLDAKAKRSTDDCLNLVRASTLNANETLTWHVKGEPLFSEASASRSPVRERYVYETIQGSTEPYIALDQ